MPRPSLDFHMPPLNRETMLRNNQNNNNVRYTTAPLINMRDHLFHAAFVKIALIYARVFSERERKIIEFLLLSLSFLSLVLLIYIHMAFVKSPSNCLAHVQQEWPRDGILRVEILREKLNGKYSLEKSYLKERKIRELAYEDLASYFFTSAFYDPDDNYIPIVEPPDTMQSANANNKDTEVVNATTDFANETISNNVTISENSSISTDETPALPTIAWSDDEYIMEFSLEYGFLKLNPMVRKQYNITVQLVTLDPKVDKCFGGPLNNFILYNFLGYDEVLLASLKLLASKEEYKGYVRNVVTEVEFIFVNAWMDQRSYITAGFVMMVFTVSISILLRYSHHQIFVFIVELLHMLEFHSAFNFPAGPLLTVILALVGMEAIMSEFFNDTAIAFYVILIVWVADQFDTICCKSIFTKKHWLRFFYLYHFFFYAYSYRFGHNRFLALLTSWLFTFHSMVYFFHRYELPLLLMYQERIRNRQHAHNNQINPDDGTNEGPPGNGSGQIESSSSDNNSPIDSNSDSALSSPSENTTPLEELETAPIQEIQSFNDIRYNTVSNERDAKVSPKNICLERDKFEKICKISQSRKNILSVLLKSNLSFIVFVNTLFIVSLSLSSIVLLRSIISNPYLISHLRKCDSCLDSC